MDNLMKKREFLAASVGLGAGFVGNAAVAQIAPASDYKPLIRPPRARREIPHRKAKTTPLFKVPATNTAGGWTSGWPNALAPAREGLWIGEQRHDGRPESAWLMDLNGKLLKTVMTQSKDTSGIAYGDGYIWMGANTDVENGFYQTDLNSNLIAIHQIPLGPKDNGGSCHGAVWNEGKLWIVANRLKGILRVDGRTWEPEYLIPINLPAATPRFHGIAWDNGAIWIVTGNDSKIYAESTPGVAKIDAVTGELLEIIEFLPGSCDPHGLAMLNGTLYSCDAGEHPGWPIGADTINPVHSTNDGNSPFGGSIFRIDAV
jgi:hypothetical protein